MDTSIQCLTIITSPGTSNITHHLGPRHMAKWPTNVCQMCDFSFYIRIFCELMLLIILIPYLHNNRTAWLTTHNGPPALESNASSPGHYRVLRPPSLPQLLLIVFYPSTKEKSIRNKKPIIKILYLTKR